MKNYDLTSLDLFCGAGGLTVGLVKAGFSVIAAIDNDPLAVETYHVNHPQVPILGSDISRISPSSLMRKTGVKRGDLDLLAACPPCQGFSTLGTRNRSRGFRDSRNKLVLEIVRFAEALFPKVLLIENVPGLVKSVYGRVLLGRLKSLGYEIACSVVDAADYGVPQRRYRAVITGSRIGVPMECPKRGIQTTVRSVISRMDQPGDSGDPLHDSMPNHSDKVLTMIRRVPKDGGSRSQIGAEAQLECHKRVDGYKDVYGRMKWDDVSPTITTGIYTPSKGRFLHPSFDRVISLREAAMLQSFAREYYFSLSGGRHGAARLIGNALPPELARRNAKALKQFLHSAL